jgi:hypothetical protein
MIAALFFAAFWIGIAFLFLAGCAAAIRFGFAQFSGKPRRRFRSSLTDGGFPGVP